MAVADWERCSAVGVDSWMLPFRLAFNDPPYNIGRTYKGDRSGDRRPTEEYLAMVSRCLRWQGRHLTSDGSCWWLCPPDHIALIEPILAACVGPVVERIVWGEAFGVYQTSGHRLTRDWRILLVASPNPSRYRVHGADRIRETSERQRLGDRRADPRGRIPGSVWDCPRLPGNAAARVGWHTTQLHPAPLARIVEGWSDPGDTVFDGFCGSASLGVVAARLGRSFAGVDRCADYVRRGLRRVRSAARTVRDGATL